MGELDYEKMDGTVFVVLFILIFICAGILGVHEGFAKKEFKTESMILEDIQYLDGDWVLFNFGDKIIKWKFQGSEMKTNISYEVGYRKCPSCWLPEERNWNVKKIKEVGK